MSIKKQYLKYLIIGIIIILGIIFIWKFDIIHNLKEDRLRKFIKSYGKLSSFIFVLLFTARTLLVFFPYPILVVAAARVFGLAEGFVLSMISLFLSATFAFYISRFMGKEFIEKLFKGRKMRILNVYVRKNGIKIIFLMRLSTVVPYDGLNYVAGLTKIKFTPFIVGTLLGSIPEVLLYSYIGSNLDRPSSFGFKCAVILLVVSLIIPIVYTKVKSSSKYTKKIDDNDIIQQ